jgi:hypothetical protein
MSGNTHGHWMAWAWNVVVLLSCVGLFIYTGSAHAFWLILLTKYWKEDLDG